MYYVIPRRSSTLVFAKRQVQQRQRRTLHQRFWRGNDVLSTVCRVPITTTTCTINSPSRASIIDCRKTRRNLTQYPSNTAASIRQFSTLRKAAAADDEPVSSGTPTSFMHETTTAACFDRSLLFSSLEDEHGNHHSRKKSTMSDDKLASKERKLIPATSSLKDDKDTSECGVNDENNENSSGGPSGYTSDVSPVYILQLHYLSKHGMRISSTSHFNAFEVQLRDPSSKTDSISRVWTATFRCPVSGREFPAGHLTWPPLLDRFPPQECTINGTGENDEAEALVWYAKKGHAVQAAAARTMDQIQYEMEQRREPRFCREDPAIDLATSSLLDAFSSQQSAEDASTGSSLPPADKAKAGLPDTEAGLKKYFDTCAESTQTSNINADSFVCENVNHNGLSSWKASFQCPVSGRWFACGRLRQHASDQLNAGPESNDSNVYYKRKNMAKKAAMARAFDVLRYERQGIREPRFCLEDPSLELDATKSPRTKAANESTGSGDRLRSDNAELIDEWGEKKQDNDPEIAVPYQQSNDRDFTFEKMHEEKHQVESLGISSSDSHVHGSAYAFNVDSLSSSSRSTSTIARDTLVGSESQDDQSYQLVKVGTSGMKSPMHRLLEVAASSAVVQSYPSGPEGGPRNPVKKSVTGIHNVKAAIAAADAWVTSTVQILSPEKNTNVHRLYLPKQVPLTTLLAAKAILVRLADANHCLPVDSAASIELCAKKILSILWKTENAHPDTDAYNLYLKCLSGSDPQSRLQEAESIYKAMKNGEAYKSSGNLLPKPNQATANAIISLTAQLGGTKGRMTKHVDKSFVPDRESFLCVLSSCVYRPVDESEVGGFDPIFAKECILRMTELAAETDNKTLKPDTQVYNAPLRWTGGPVLWAESRPYARYIPWEDYETVYMNGLRETVSDSDSRVRQAKAAEAWLNMMTELSGNGENVAPDIETYEAIIQAWLKTATREGLARAESLVEGIMRTPSRVKARIQTLHPLIAAWYHSGDPNNTLLKISRWTDNLTECDPELANRLRADPKVIEIRMMAHISEQKRLLQMMKKSNNSKEQVSGVFDAAVGCSNILKDACVRLEHQRCGLAEEDIFLDMQLFDHCGQAWKNAATACDISGEKDCLDQIAVEIVHQFDIFESMARAVIAAEAPRGIGPGTHKPMSMQFAHIVAYAHQFFFILIENLVSLEEQRARASFVSSARTLVMLEKMIRIVGEFEEIDFFMSLNAENNPRRDNTWIEAGSPDRSTLFTDNFSYGVKGDNRFSPTRYSLLWQAVKYLEERPLDNTGKGELGRLCFLIKTVGKKLRNSPKLEEVVDRILDRNTSDSPSPSRAISDEFAQTTLDDKKRRSRIGRGRHISKMTKNRRHASTSHIAKGKKMGSAL